MGVANRFPKGQRGVEAWLEAERGQIILWLPVAFGAGIAAWFAMQTPAQWIGFMCTALAIAAAGMIAAGRAGRVLLVAGLASALGCGMVWLRAEAVSAPVLARPVAVSFDATVRQVDAFAARGVTRLVLQPIGRADLPPRVRVNVDMGGVPEGLAPGARVALRARLVPPPPPSMPGAYDFRRVAWFNQIGATGKALGSVKMLSSEASRGPGLRARLSAHIQSRLSGSAGGIATALVTGDEGAIDEADGEAMRRAGLAHLLSVSGLHVTAVTGATMLIVLRVLALSPSLALRVRLPLVAAGAAALAAIGYTWLTGAQVPTIRSCVAALLVLAALSLGREAVTLRLVAAGAMVVLALWPEALAGASFQLSFAAVAAIVALHENVRVRRWCERREEGRLRRIGRSLVALLLTGFVVELALMPIGLFHFHKAGLYGAFANLVAIPLTTFVVMPLEALALLLDCVGLGWPAWWLVGRALALLLVLAHVVANAPGSVAALPVMPGAAFGLIVFGGLWIALWRTPMRVAGTVPLVAGLAWATLSPVPDLLVTGDGRHLAVRMPDGSFALLRDGAKAFTRTALSEMGGVEEGALTLLAQRPEARCSADLCVADVAAGARRWRIAATRSGYAIAWGELVATCAASDLVVSERRLPRACRPRWLLLDRTALNESGGVAIAFAGRSIRSVETGARHPWLHPRTVQPPFKAVETHP